MSNADRVSQRLKSPQRIGPRQSGHVGTPLGLEQFGAIRRQCRNASAVVAALVLTLRSTEARRRLFQLPLPLLPESDFVPKCTARDWIFCLLDSPQQLLEALCLRSICLERFELQQ